jgi:uncharacterized protein involved in outer membrane biogenesis
MKKVLIGVAVLLVVLVGGVLAAPSFIDWNSYKGQIAAQVHDATGRDLTIDGDISLSILWTPTLSVSKVRFANVAGGSAPDMATLESLDVRLAFTPLDWLDGNFQVQRVELVQPTILLEKLADGRANWQFQETADAGAGTGGADSGRDIRLDSITITNGTLIYRDAAADSEQRIEALNADLGATSLRGPFRANGSLSYQGIPVMFTTTASELSDAAPTEVNVQIGLAKTDTTLKFAGNVATAPEIGVKGRLDLTTADLSVTLDSLAPGAAAGTPIALDKAFQVGGDIVYGGAGGEVQNLAVSLGDVTATGALKFAPGAPAKAEAKLGLNRLDLDALLGSIATAESDGDSAPQTGADAGEFALPRDIDATVAVAVGAISYRGGVVNDARLEAALSEGRLTLSELSALLPGGSSISATGTVAAADGAPQFIGALDGKSDNLRALLDWLQVAPAQVPADRLRTLALKSKVTATPSSLEVQDLDVQLDSSHITGGARIALANANRAKPAFGVGLAIDQLNLDAYLPPSPETGGAGSGQSEAGGLPLDGLAPLAGIDANVELRVGKLTLNEQTLQSVHLDGTLQAGALTLRDLSVKEFAGGKGAMSGTITDLAGQPRFDTKFDLSAKDAGKAFQLAGLGKAPPGKLGALKLSGTLSGGAQDVAYDVAFSIAGVGASGAAKGKATGIGAGVPRIDTTFDLKAKDAGPIATFAGMSAADASKLGAVSLAGTAASGADDLTYDVTISMAGVGGQGQFKGKLAGLSGTPQVDTRLDFTAKKPAPLLALAGMAGPAAGKVGQLGIAGTMAGNADNMKLDLGLQGFGASAKVAGTVMAATPPARFDLAISADHPEFRDLLAALVPGYKPQADKLGPLALSAKANGSTDSASVSDLSLKAGQTSLAGNLKLDQTGARPFVTTALRGGVVDLTPFSPPAGSGGGGGAGGERWSREPLDLSILESFDADVDFAADRFVSGETQIDNLQAKLTVRDGTLTITQLTGNTFGGAIDLTGTLASRGVPTFNGRIVAENVNVRDVSGSSFVQGPVSFNADLNSSGYSMAELMDALQGTGKVDGTVTVLGEVEQVLGTAALSVLGQQLSKLTGVKQVQGVTNYINAAYQAFVGRPNALNGNFNIARGVLNTQDLSFANDQAKALITGDADIGAWTIGMLVNVFSMQFPDQPCLMVDLAGILDSPTPKPRGGGGCGGEGGSAAAPFGGLNPGDLFGVAVPGLDVPQGAEPGSLPGSLPEVLPGLLPGLTGGGAAEPAPDAPVVNVPDEVIPEQVAPEPAEPTEAPAVGEQAAPEQQPAEEQGTGKADKKKKAKKKKGKDKQQADQAAPAEEPAERPPPSAEAAPAEPAPAAEPEPAPMAEPAPEAQPDEPQPVQEAPTEPPAAEAAPAEEAPAEQPPEEPAVVPEVQPAPEEQLAPAEEAMPAEPAAPGVGEEALPGEEAIVPPMEPQQ